MKKQPSDNVHTSPKRGRGRPLEYTPEKVRPILLYIQEGNYETIAVAAADVCCWEAHLRWKKAFPEYAEAIKKAEAIAETQAQHIVRSGRQGWQGCAWWLERKHRDRWQRPELVQHSGDLSLNILWENSNGNGNGKRPKRGK